MATQPIDHPFYAHLRDLVLNKLLKGPCGALPKGSVIEKVAEFHEYDEAEERGLEDWVLLRQEVAGELGYQISKNDQDLYDELNRATEELWKEISQEVWLRRKLEFVDEVMQDFLIIWRQRHVENGDNLLSGQLLKTYEAGAMPTGWRGTYPEGNLVVYWPYDQEPTFESEVT